MDNQLTEEQVMGMFVVDLKRELKARGLRAHGLKRDLQTRLLNYLNNPHDHCNAPLAPSQQQRGTNQHYQTSTSTAPAALPNQHAVTNMPHGTNLVRQGPTIAPTAGMGLSPLRAPAHHQPYGNIPSALLNFQNPYGFQIPSIPIIRPNIAPHTLLPQQALYPQPQPHFMIRSDMNLVRNSLSFGTPQAPPNGIEPEVQSAPMPAPHNESSAVSAPHPQQTLGVSGDNRSSMALATVKKEADVELEWEYAPLGTQNLWIPVEDGISGQLDALQSQHILVHQSGPYRYDIHRHLLNRLDMGVCMPMRQAPKGTSPVSRIPRGLWPAVIELVKLGFSSSEAVDGVKAHGNDIDQASIYLVTRRENGYEAAEIALAQNASKELYELEEAKRRAQEKKDKEHVDLFTFPSYRGSFLLNIFRAHPSLQAAVYETLDVRKPLQAILELEVNCRKWYPESVHYFKQLAKSISQVTVSDLATFLSSTAALIEREVVALPTVAGATPQIFRQARKRPQTDSDDDCCLIESHNDADGDDSDVECIAVRDGREHKAPQAIIDLD